MFAVLFWTSYFVHLPMRTPSVSFIIYVFASSWKRSITSIEALLIFKQAFVVRMY